MHVDITIKFIHLRAGLVTTLFKIMNTGILDDFAPLGRAALVELYKQTNAEITRYRDLEWKIPGSVVLLLGGVLTGVRVLPGDDIQRIWFKTGLGVFTILTMGYGLWHLHFVHNKLIENRKLRVQIEVIFRFHEPNVYCDAPVLPPKLKEESITFESGLTHILSWRLLMVMVAIYTGCVVLFS